MTSPQEHRSGFIALVGRPNVGKSTLLNTVLGQKISITTPKPQTTRHRIIGIKTTADAQSVYVDTPGLHREAKRAMNRMMNRTARDTLRDVDVAVMVLEAGKWTEEDEGVLDLLRSAGSTVLLAINKVDRLRDKASLLPFLERMQRMGGFEELIPLSALRGDQVDVLETAVIRHLPEGPPLYPEDQITDRSERFLAAELIREKLMLRLRAELPYALTVAVERFERSEELLSIDAVIWLEREQQKAIVIGRQGVMLKEIGRAARLELERQFGMKVFLNLWAKVRRGWSDNEHALRSLGYGED